MVSESMVQTEKKVIYGNFSGYQYKKYSRNYGAKSKELPNGNRRSVTWLDQQEPPKVASKPIFVAIKKRLRDLSTDLDEDQDSQVFKNCAQLSLSFIQQFALPTRPLIGVTDQGTVTYEWRDKSQLKLRAFLHFSDTEIEFRVYEASIKAVLAFRPEDLGSASFIKDFIQKVLNELKY